MMLFPPALLARAEALIAVCAPSSVMLTTAESCTGGLVAALLTEVAGSSSVVDRGFVTYSNEAKVQMLGVSVALLAEHGAVSEACAVAMAEGALARSRADIALSITGIAGPGGGTLGKPVGLVHFAVARRGAGVAHAECRFGDVGRQAVRLAAVTEAMELFEAALRS